MHETASNLALGQSSAGQSRVVPRQRSVISEKADADRAYRSHRSQQVSALTVVRVQSLLVSQAVDGARLSDGPGEEEICGASRLHAAKAGNAKTNATER